jgi:hypothetical protein
LGNTLANWLNETAPQAYQTQNEHYQQDRLSMYHYQKYQLPSIQDRYFTAQILSLNSAGYYSIACLFQKFEGGL